MTAHICKDCNKDLGKLAATIGADPYVVTKVHEVVHLKEKLEQREVQLAKLQAACRALLDNWEKNLSEYASQISSLTPAVLECPWCEGPILDNLTEEDCCPHCEKQLRMITNRYRCEDCNEEWEDEWDCECDDECPKCGTSMSPYESEQERATYS